MNATTVKRVYCAMISRIKIIGFAMACCVLSSAATGQTNGTRDLHRDGRSKLRIHKPQLQSRPTAAQGKKATAASCNVPIEQLHERLPFGPGEELGYVIYVAGVYVGRAGLQVGERSSLGGQVLYPLHAHATTNSFFKNMSRIDSNQTSYVQPDGIQPVSMFSRAQYDKLLREEEARFNPEKKTADALLRLGARESKGTYQAALPIQDVVSVIYFARSRRVQPNSSYCLNLYYGKRLWLVRGQVGPVEVVSTEAGPYRAFLLQGTALRTGTPQLERAFKVWISDDEDRIPVLLTSPSAYGEIEVRVDHFKKGRNLVRQTE